MLSRLQLLVRKQPIIISNLTLPHILPILYLGSLASGHPRSICLMSQQTYLECLGMQQAGSRHATDGAVRNMIYSTYLIVSDRATIYGGRNGEQKRRKMPWR